MPSSSTEVVFCIEPARESDWARLEQERQREVSWQMTEQRTAQQVEKLRREEGFPNQAFIARAGDGTLAGFVWVARTHNDSTGQLEASLLNQYVAEAFYRVFLTDRTSVTPDIQLIVNPSLAPSRRNVWVFGLRLRTTF